jgi:hypothetical protein
LKYQVCGTGFFVYFKLEFFGLQQAENASSNWEKNPVHQGCYFKLKNCKNQLQIDWGCIVFRFSGEPDFQT